MRLIDGIKKLNEIAIYFAENMNDEFIYRLKEKLVQDQVSKIILRKAMNVTSLPFESLFTLKMGNL